MLVVDDHIATTDTLRSLVVIWGHDVRHAYDGRKGLILAAEYRPDVLLLDMLMPGVNGFDIIKQMRQQNHLMHCFIVAITGRTDATHLCRTYEAGADLVLVKPVAPTHLQSLLDLESGHFHRSQFYEMGISPVLTRAARSELATYRNQIGAVDVGSGKKEP